jgi:hypothetical protein
MSKIRGRAEAFTGRISLSKIEHETLYQRGVSVKSVESVERGVGARARRRYFVAKGAPLDALAFESGNWLA